MMQDKEALEDWYSQGHDPWAYRSNADDIKRKSYILSSLSIGRMFKSALDLGCGEAWVTRDLPAEKIYGYELSDIAASRFPSNVERVSDDDIRGGRFDLVVATGILYDHYNLDRFIEIINKCACGVILTCNIKNWEKGIDRINAQQVSELEFPYRDHYTQKLRVFHVFASQDWSAHK